MSVSNGDAEKTKPKKTLPEDPQAKTNSRLVQLSLAVLGVVFGDIGTSPIYAIWECFHGEYGITVSHVNVVGILSLMFWALVMIVGRKYMVFVFRADNRGKAYRKLERIKSMMDVAQEALALQQSRKGCAWFQTNPRFPPSVSQNITRL